MSDLDLSVYLVTDTRQCGERGVPTVVAAAVEAGVRTVQVRDHEASTAELLTLVLAVASVLDERTVVLVDDRVDVVLAARLAGAVVHGVHLGQSDLPTVAARSLLGANSVIGLTVNTPTQLAHAHALPPGTVDYFGMGVIRTTATKSDHPEPLGLDGFASLASGTALPCVAIGGVTAGDVAPLRRAGAAGVAVVSAICAAPDPGHAAHLLREEWER
ncbi:thiamine phosphate synthase [Rathayibacter toxicus]|uniref:thiamine phosphate synthase n=1 Tax=Rathayibacter toxicus TaxID=145458 RepID=UPI001C046B49|nr:thiamine phosphate synthase [Rathayibacter toxicus]QWL32063.1 thiamine phosphate synthase [Rathayibacter toxicus]QWL34157.1 thiamine phosphate synthase [Rathayibacter toxicus]QWL36289.1 thiamine phosphate synthase [Rathayibacter toxicus]QWL38380.1 thiamine phosphate synthase [Rathayibacter toxicus]QWL40469.1 thiamine phosphate synthase [Rathayibacter toxicus]